MSKIFINGAERREHGRAIVTKKGEGASWDFPQQEIWLGGEYYLEKYQILSRAPSKSAIIDVGCRTSNWMGLFHSIIPPTVMRIGIDPMDYGVAKLIGGDGKPLYDQYYQYAIDNVKNQYEAIFHTFNEEPGCNSLMEKTEYMKWNESTPIKVQVRSLESIILEACPNKKIYYLKCDCQGKDVDVVKSMGPFLSETDFVEVECSFQENKLYKGQRGYKDEILIMDEMGFKPIFYVQFDNGFEGEILFQRNTDAKNRQQ